jgi:P27 family predicted phage terminase small subunit
MTRGRKPVPTQLKILRGNPGKRSLNKDEPKFSPKCPKPPTWLTLEARAEWRRVVPELDAKGLLATIDRGQLASYCSWWSIYVDAIREIQKNGLTTMAIETTSIDGYVIFVRPTKNPAIIVARDASEKVRQFGTEFGLSPSSRTRLHVPEVEDTSLEELLGGPTSS